MAQWINCLLCKYEDLNPNPSAHAKARYPCQGQEWRRLTRWTQSESMGLGGSYTSSQAPGSMRTSVSETKMDQGKGKILDGLKLTHACR